MNLRELREKRANKIKEAQGILDKSRGEKRSLTPEEKTLYDNLLGEIDVLKEDITREERAEELAAEQAGRTQPVNTHNTTEARSIASYSLLKAVRSALPGGKPLEGIEKEMHQQADKEARDAGHSLKGVGVPQMLIAGSREQRDNGVTAQAGVFTQPDDGAAVVERTLRPVIDITRPNTPLRQLGAQYLTGLVGNVGVPTLTQGAVSTWKKEVETLDKSNQKFSSADMTPHRLGTYAVRSLQFLAQTSPAVEAMLRTDLENSISQALEEAAINGSGTNNQPLGLLNTPGTLAFDMGPNGGNPTRAMLIGMQALVEDQNIRVDTPGYLINVLTKATLLNTKVDPSNGIFLMSDNGQVLATQVGVTSLVPKNLSKGTGTNLSAAIFGNWRDLLIGQWGGLDITVDPYTLAADGEVRIIIQSFFDVLCQRPKAFAVAKGIVASIPQAA